MKYNSAATLKHGPVAVILTLKDVLELVLLQGSCHHLFDGADVLIQFDHQGVIVHAGSIGHDGIVPLLSHGDEIVEAMHPTEGRHTKDDSTSTTFSYLQI